MTSNEEEFLNYYRDAIHTFRPEYVITMMHDRFVKPLGRKLARSYEEQANLWALVSETMECLDTSCTDAKRLKHLKRLSKILKNRPKENCK